MSNGLKIALLVVSDRASRGEMRDGCAQALGNWLADKGQQIATVKISPDGAEPVATILRQWVEEGEYELILTAGGTGLSRRDQTPEATLSVADRLIPGIAEAMRAASQKITPHALLSRAVAVQRGNTIIINLPGAPQAAVENLAVIFECLSHGIKKIGGDQSDCAPRS